MVGYSSFPALNVVIPPVPTVGYSSCSHRGYSLLFPPWVIPENYLPVGYFRELSTRGVIPPVPHPVGYSPCFSPLGYSRFTVGSCSQRCTTVHILFVVDHRCRSGPPVRHKVVNVRNPAPTNRLRIVLRNVKNVLNPKVNQEGIPAENKPYPRGNREGKPKKPATESTRAQRGRE